MKKIFILFPNNLFKEIEPLKHVDDVYLLEEFLFFKQYKFHKQKLVLHRASMKFYETYLSENNVKVNYLQSTSQGSDVRVFLKDIKETEIHFYDVCDNWLEKRIKEYGSKNGNILVEHTSPLFINSKQELDIYNAHKTKYFQTDFYIFQRKKLKILVDEKNNPIGGKWSFDSDNRLKYPKNKIAPLIKFPLKNKYYHEAERYVAQYFAENYGSLSSSFVYPTTHQEGEDWLQEFLEKRFAEFGAYEDAIVDNEVILHHSVLSPILNIGLITPMEIVNAALDFAAKNNTSLNSLEGFIRQIIGWREFIRCVYIYRGTLERTTNFWQFTKPIPPSFYDGTTKIKPLDDTIKKILATGYCHHIERLMIVGNFMLLCEFHPDQVYQWFMELFIDAYDWVMVTNIYGMSQFADGGLMATKPYISGSNYILKMSNYKKDNWCNIWDALFWQFINKHRVFFLSNARLGMLVKTYDKMSDAKKDALTKTTFEIDLP